jgi:hypothetical protein
VADDATELKPEKRPWGEQIEDDERHGEAMHPHRQLLGLDLGSTVRAIVSCWF